MVLDRYRIIDYRFNFFTSKYSIEGERVDSGLESLPGKQEGVSSNPSRGITGFLVEF